MMNLFNRCRITELMKIRVIFCEKCMVFVFCASQFAILNDFFGDFLKIKRLYIVKTNMYDSQKKIHAQLTTKCAIMPRFVEDCTSVADALFDPLRTYDWPGMAGFDLMLESGSGTRICKSGYACAYVRTRSSAPPIAKALFSREQHMFSEQNCSQILFLGAQLDIR